ncbi:aminopeptidase P family protein [Sphingomonas sp. SUN039]|uniref:aminopeptidase P family protein n=1 Tax=Sphingomonas sp. SUN039 TaxID=2937787 RepID=UPI0021649C7A|nr:aminopeptidase P family protein [Sphingomonas sp. SUN039]UVO54839.1 aminopeptidase P family protein [Sphingomonas sp. SUN039]
MADHDLPNYAARLTAFRTQLAADGLDGFVVPLTDEHMSEYVGDYAKRLEWLTGFRGSAGAAAVLPDRAAVFVDGRYTLQVQQQVDGSLFDYVGVPQSSIAAWLGEHAKAGARIGYDPWLHNKGWVESVGKVVTLVPVARNPLDAVWADRPAMSPAKLKVQSNELAGRSAADKRAEIADWLTGHGLDATVMTALDSVAWTFNLRGDDVTHTPVGLAFAILHADATADLFVEPHKIDETVRAALGNGVRVHDRAAFAAMLASLQGKRIASDPERAVVAVFDALAKGGATIVEARDPAVLAKAIKNRVEQAGQRSAQARDGAALSRYLHWLSVEAPKGGLTEISASDQLRKFREATGKLLDLSFDTISGAGPHGAIMHYKASAETDRRIDPSSVYLCDSGGQYADGTTDVTRTIWVGPGDPPAEVKDRFTRVLQGHIAIARAVFPAGTTGGQLDGFARQFLWAAGCDYAHGTGHGVGAFLAVHEGPQRIAKPGGGQPGTAEPLVAGMFLSNEPGYYKPDHYGIRIENLVLVEERQIAGGDMPMLGFETLTFAPIDKTMIEPALLSDAERAWLDGYHADVLRIVGPQVEGEAKAWLESVCAPL